jgi:hypothetical protein
MTGFTYKLCTIAAIYALTVQESNATWCESLPVRMGKGEGFSFQDLKMGNFAHAVFLVASVNGDYHTTKKLITDVAKRAEEFGVSTVIVDEEGSPEENAFVHKYGEGPMPRLVLYHDRPGFSSRPLLLTTEVHGKGVEGLVDLIERHVADLDVESRAEVGCPQRRVKRGVTHLSEAETDAGEL